MAISLANLRQRSDRKPPRLLTYGTHGIGKTSLAQSFPSPVFLQTEESEVDVPTFGLLRSYGDVFGALSALYTEQHDFRTVVLDSLDWLEPLVWAETCRLNNWANIEAVSFGKGYLAALDQWRALLDGFSALRDDKDMAIVLIAHCDIKRFESPETEPYDRYQIKLHSRASALIQEHVDGILFANYRVQTVKTDLGFNRKAVRGVGGGDRLLWTTERPAFIAKNRWNMPDSIPLSWDHLAACIPYYADQLTNPATAQQQGSATNG
jgi:hypothetical protein